MPWIGGNPDEGCGNAVVRPFENLDERGPSNQRTPVIPSSALLCRDCSRMPAGSTRPTARL